MRHRRQRQPAPEGSESRLVRNTLVNAAGTLISVAATLALTPLLIHHLGADAYGAWLLATSLSFGLGYLAFADLGFEQASIRYIAEARAAHDTRAMNEILTCTFVLLGGVSLVLAPPLILLSGPIMGLFGIPESLEGPATVACQFIVAQLIFELPGRAFASLLEGAQRYGLWQLVRFVQAIVVSGLMAVSVLTGHGIDALGRATFAATAIIFAFGAVIAFIGVPEARMRPSLLSRRTMAKLARFSGQLLVFRLLASVYRQIDRTVIGVALVTSVVTTYEIGNRISGGVALIQGLATTAVVPTAAYSRDNLPRLRDMLLRGTNYSLAVALPPTIAAAIFASPLIDSWIGTGYDDATGPTQLLLGVLALGYLMTVGQTILIGLGRVREMLWMVVGWTLLNLGLSILLVGPLDIYGPILATLISTAILVIPMTWVFLDQMKVGLPTWLREALLPCVPAAAVQFAVGLVLLPVARHQSLIVVALLAGVSMLAAWVAYWFLGLRRRDRGYLITTARRALGLEPDAPAPEQEPIG